MTPPAAARTRTGKTTRRTPKPEFDVDAAKRRLIEVGKEIDDVNEERDDLYAERLDLWKRLGAAGVERSELADLAGTTPGAMKFALHVDKRRKESTPPG